MGEPGIQGPELPSSKKHEPERCDASLFQTNTVVNNTEFASAGGLLPVKDEEVDGLAAL